MSLLRRSLLVGVVALAASFPLSARAQQGVVAGMVVDGQTLQPMAGAQIQVVGTGQGVLSDAQGRFRIGNLQGAEVTLHVVRLGYRDLTRTVRVGDANVRLDLTETALELDAIIVTGTAGAVQRRSIGNVVTSIDASAAVETGAVPDIGQLLNGRVPGVVVAQSSGVVGGGARIRIRGAASFSLSDQPLIYVDGVRVNNQVSSGPMVQSFGGSPVSRLNDINPNDIESVEIIKGPAAATLYGTEASNGVIQIITKKGATSGRPKVDMRLRQGGVWFANPEGRVPANYWKNPATGEILGPMRLLELENARGTPVFRNGHLQGYGLDLSGGTDAFRYFAGANYDRDGGIEPDNFLRRFTGRINFSVAVDPSLSVDANLSLVRSTTGFGQSQLFHSLLMGHPNFLNTPKRGWWSAPPEAIWEARDASQKVNRFMAGFKAEHSPFAWFRHRLTVGLDLTDEHNEEVTPRMSAYVAQFYSASAARGARNTSLNNIEYSTVDYSATVDLPLTDEVQSQTSAGVQYYRNHTSMTSAQGQEFPVEGLQTIAATAVTFGSDDFFTNTTVGVFLQEQVAWRNRVFVTGAVRVDDNSAFGESFSFVYYPKASASWVVSEEPFWRVPFVSSLRLRTAFGRSGQQPETFAALRTYKPVTAGDGTGAVTPQFIGNPDLGPERGQEWEAGFEAALLDERLEANFTYYHQNTKDAILLQEQPPSMGFPGFQYVNLGEIKNTGAELMLSLLAVERPSLNWRLVANLSTNENEVLSLGDNDFIPISENDGGTRNAHVVGYPVGAWFQKNAVSADLDAKGKAINVMCDGGPENENRPVPCSVAPRVYLGRTSPKYEGSFNSTLALFGRFNLSVLVDFKSGFKKDLLNGLGRCFVRLLCEENVFPERFPAYIQAEFQDPNLFATHTRIFDASFVTLREIAGSYTFPESWAASFGASRATLRVGWRNIHTWTGFPGLDPETHRMNYLNVRSDQDLVPQLQQLVSTLSITF